MSANIVRVVPAALEIGPKTAQLRRLLDPREFSFIMAAHNGLSARIVEETGFQYNTGQWLDIEDALDLAQTRNLL